MNTQVDVVEVAKNLARLYFNMHDENTWIYLTEDWELCLDHYLGKPRATLYPVEQGFVQVADFIPVKFKEEHYELPN